VHLDQVVDVMGRLDHGEIDKDAARTELDRL
jgi:hypothetical protein